MVIVAAFSGVLLAEGFSRFTESDSCPKGIQTLSDTLTEPLKKASIPPLVCGTLSGVILTQGALLIVAKGFKGRVNWIATCAQKTETTLRAYHVSLPLIVTGTVYIGRREVLEALLESIKALFNLAEEAGSKLSQLILNSDELAEKIEQEIQEGLRGIHDSIRYILFANEPEVIQTITKEISDFENHVKTLSKKMPAFERKLLEAKKLLVDSKSHLITEIQAIESQSHIIEEMIQSIQTEHVSYWEEKFKVFIDEASLLEKQESLKQKLAQLQNLSQKIERIILGMDLIYQADMQECKAIRRWNIYIKYTPLPLLEDAFLLAYDLPNLSLKMFREIAFNTKERADDLISYRRRRIKLSEILPKGVANFSQALILFKKTRKHILDKLSQLQSDAPLNQENWEEEKAFLKRGRQLFNEGDLIFCATLFKNHPLGKAAARICAISPLKILNQSAAISYCRNFMYSKIRRRKR